MKYRVQLTAVFDNTNANAILNHVESIKTQVYDAQSPTVVPIERKGKKLEYIEDFHYSGTEYEVIDFDISQQSYSVLHIGTEFTVEVDISFVVEQNCKDFLNYIEGIKSNAVSSKIRTCRWFECRHEEALPLVKDGAYSYLDFDGEQIIH